MTGFLDDFGLTDEQLLIRRYGKVRARLLVRVRDAGGNLGTAKRVLALKAPSRRAR